MVLFTTCGNNHSFNATKQVSSISANTLLPCIFIVLAHASGFLINFTIIIMIIKVNKIKSLFDSLIFHLAICDLLFVIPVFIYVGALYGNYFISWPVAILNPTCKMVVFFAFMGITLHSYTLVLISFERYRIIVHPAKPRMKGRHIIITLLAMWLLLAIAPVCIISDVVPIPDTKYRYICLLQIKEGSVVIVLLALYFLLFGYLMPICIMLYCYIRIIRRLRQISMITRKRFRDQTEGQRQRKRIIVSLICISTLFIIFEFPLMIALVNVICLRSHVTTSAIENYLINNNTNYFIGFFINISPIFDPIVYLIKSKKIRQLCARKINC
ncbi:Neuropeptide Y receptor type 1 [Trichoplax sp. H2]|nr:Neuropeptide Y receptor type 1 [Trichoplax sp. H2]|eukprot:RDD37916.1 Neuropeptide Y receptor type 1 [Trichoplax sp. H2]